MTELRKGLPAMPARLLDLPIDERGYPVPWFVAWFDGKPDHRVVDTAKLGPAVNASLCWICGKHLGTHKTLPIGPMCTITRTIAEPPSHLDCARWSVQACPFLSRPHAKRREAGLPDEELKQATGMIMRNPQAVCLWTTKHFKAYKSEHAKPGERDLLFDFEGEPEAIEWWAQGRPASKAEVLASIETGLPLLREHVNSKAAASDLSQRLTRELRRIAAYKWVTPDEPEVD